MRRDEKEMMFDGLRDHSGVVRFVRGSIWVQMEANPNRADIIRMKQLEEHRPINSFSSL